MILIILCLVVGGFCLGLGVAGIYPMPDPANDFWWRTGGVFSAGIFYCFFGIVELVANKKKDSRI